MIGFCLQILRKLLVLLVASAIMLIVITYPSACFVADVVTGIAADRVTFLLQGDMPPGAINGEWLRRSKEQVAERNPEIFDRCHYVLAEQIVIRIQVLSEEVEPFRHYWDEPGMLRFRTTLFSLYTAEILEVYTASRLFSVGDTMEFAQMQRYVGGGDRGRIRRRVRLPISEGDELVLILSSIRPHSPQGLFLLPETFTEGYRIERNGYTRFETIFPYSQFALTEQDLLRISEISSENRNRTYSPQ